MTEWSNVTPPPEPARDRFERPMIIPVGGGKPVPYTRCTTYVGCLEDTYNLSLWQKQMVAVGLALRSDLLLRAASLGTPPPKDADAQVIKAWKKRMNEVTDAATEAAQASASARVGTSLHAICEAIDRGQDVGPIPEQYRQHIENYQTATEQFTAVHIEQFTVNDDLQVGGTPDRVLTVPGSDRLVIGDIKTGTVDYGTGKMAMQLSVYAHSQLYDPMTGDRTPLGDVDLDHGIIIALDAFTGECRLIDIDLSAGWQAVQLAGQVRAWRKRKDLTRPYVLPTPAAEIRQLDPDMSLVKAIRTAHTETELVELWLAAGDRWDSAHTELATKRKAELRAAV